MWLFFVSLLVLSCFAQKEEKEFSIRPSVDDSVSVTIAGVVCKFAWKDCTGGSSEVWHMRLEMKNSGPVCSVGRAFDSYLTFTTWEAELSGGGVSDGDASLTDGEGGPMLRNSDFSVFPAPNGGILVRNGSSKRHTLNKIQLVGR